MCDRIMHAVRIHTFQGGRQWEAWKGDHEEEIKQERSKQGILIYIIDCLLT